MMKRIISLLVAGVMSSCMSMYAQTADNSTKMSKLDVRSRITYDELKSAQREDVLAKSMIMDDGKTPGMQAFMEVNGVAVYEQLESMGVTFGYGCDNLVSAVIPSERLNDVLALEGVLRLEFASEAV